MRGVAWPRGRLIDGGRGGGGSRRGQRAGTQHRDCAATITNRQRTARLAESTSRTLVYTRRTRVESRDETPPTNWHSSPSLSMSQCSPVKPPSRNIHGQRAFKVHRHNTRHRRLAKIVICSRLSSQTNLSKLKLSPIRQRLVCQLSF